jgi:hypothetical protein
MLLAGQNCEGRGRDSAFARLEMTKKTISSGDLAMLISERLTRTGVCPLGFPVAIVPTAALPGDWLAVVSHRDRIRHPKCVQRLIAIEREMRKLYLPQPD